MANTIPTGLRNFIVLWLGQLVSVIGSGMTSFALGIMTYQKTGSVGDLALVVLAFSLPAVLASPLAGAILDRFNRLWVLALSALGSGLCTLAIYAVVTKGGIQIWQIYACVAGISFFGAVQGPALTVLTAILIPKDHLARANGLWQLGQGLSLIVAPLVAAMLMSRIGIRAVVIVDFCTYIAAIASLIFVSLPHRGGAPDNAEKRPIMQWSAIAGGWSYVRSRAALLRLLGLFAIIHFVLDMVQVLIVPAVLNLGTEKDLANVVAVTSVGMIVGGIFMTVWGGPKRRILGVLGACVVMGIGLCIAGLFPKVSLAAAGMFIFAVAIPIALSCNGAIWQLKTDLAHQGRVFALESMVAQSAQPIACLLAGPLIDAVFDPLMVPGGAAASTLGPIVGSGIGGGAGLFMAVLGGIVLLATCFGAASARLRRIDDDLPDATSPGSAASGADLIKGSAIS
jgi:MFS transporter, DHA3 family, macrolide efflux protein